MTALALGALLPRGHFTTSGVLLAAASGSIASGIGYTLWYAALPSLAAWRAALVQTITPVLTIFLAALFLGESVSTRLLIATGIIAVGVGVATQSAMRPRHRL